MSATCPKCYQDQPVIRNCWRCSKEWKFRCFSPELCWEFSGKRQPAYESWYCHKCRFEHSLDHGAADLLGDLLGCPPWLEYIKGIIRNHWLTTEVNLNNAITPTAQASVQYPNFTMELLTMLSENCRVVCMGYQGDGSDDQHLLTCQYCRCVVALRQKKKDMQGQQASGGPSNLKSS